MWHFYWYLLQCYIKTSLMFSRRCEVFNNEYEYSTKKVRKSQLLFFLHINFEQWKCQIFLWSSFYLVCLFRNCKVILSEKFQFRPFWSILVLIHKNNLITRESLNQSGILEEAQVFLLCLGLISSITFQFGDLGQVSLIFTKKFRTVWWLLERSDQREK